jgi:hypothetical protein
MVMETIDKVISNLGAADIDARLEELLVDGILYAFQEQVRWRRYWLCTHEAEDNLSCYWELYPISAIDGQRLAYELGVLQKRTLCVTAEDISMYNNCVPAAWHAFDYPT